MKINIEKNQEILLNFGRSSYLRFIPLAQVNDIQRYYPILKMDTLMSISGLTMGSVKDINFFLKSKFKLAISNMIEELQKLKEEI